LVKKAKIPPQSLPLAGQNLEIGRNLLKLPVQGFASPKAGLLILL
jgi:hypothetical protein